jgi:thiosulfate/3-mercaptopyruvate sulfurtransferase
MSRHTLIQAEALAARLDDPRLRIFDCRFDLARPDSGRERYLDEHLPGAVYADLNRDLSAPATRTSGRHPLPAPATFTAQLRAWGVNADSCIGLSMTSRT